MTEDQRLIQDLESFNLTISTVAYVAGVKEVQVWKWKTAQIPIPPKHREKLRKLIERLK